MRRFLALSALLWFGVTSTVSAFTPLRFLGLRRHKDDRFTYPTVHSRQVRGGNCTDRSLALQSLRIFDGKLFTKDLTGSESTSISFRLGNVLTGQSERCAAEGPGVTYDVDTWYNCDHLADPTAPRSSFRFDFEKNIVSVQGTWICSDKDPANPLSLEAFANGNIPWVCADLKDDDRWGSGCTQEKEAEFPVEMSSRPAYDG